MKQLIQITLIAGLLALLSACKSPEVTAFHTINATGEMADAALASWAAYCKQVEGTPKRITLAQHLEAKRVWDIYQQALKTTEALVIAYKKAQAAYEAGDGIKPSIETVNATAIELYNIAMEFINLLQQIKEAK